MSQNRSQRIMYFYQTFLPNDTQTLLHSPQMKHVTDVFIGAIHFGNNPDPYVHLNDYPPSHFPRLFRDLAALNPAIRVHVMLGGAGGGLEPLIERPDIFYPLFRDTVIPSFLQLDGINIDIEEGSLEECKVEAFIKQVKHDFPYLSISMAPVIGELNSFPNFDNEWFSHAKLVRSKTAHLVDCYLVQAYSPEAFAESSLSGILTGPNSYYLCPEKIGVGMMTGQMGPLSKVTAAVRSMYAKYPTFSGIFDWELFGSTPGWSTAVRNGFFTMTSCVLL